MVTIGPLGWYCSSGSCRTTGDVQEIEEVWEVEYGVGYAVQGYHNV